MKKFSKLKIVALLVLTMVSVSVFTVYALPKAVDVSDNVNYINTAVSNVDENMEIENNRTFRFDCFRFKNIFNKMFSRFETNKKHFNDNNCMHSNKNHSAACKNNKKIEKEMIEYEVCCAWDKYGSCSKVCVYEKPKPEDKEVCCSFDKYGNCSKYCIIEEPKVKHFGKVRKGNSINNKKNDVVIKDKVEDNKNKSEERELCCAWDQYGNCLKTCIIKD